MENLVSSSFRTTMSEKQLPNQVGEDKETSPESLVEQKSKQSESVESSAEIRRKTIEKRLLELAIPPSSPFRKTVWKLALAIQKSRTESETKQKELNKTKNAEINPEAYFSTTRIVESIFSAIAREVILPFLSLLLTFEHKAKLEEYRNEYSDLLSFMADTESTTDESKLPEA